MYEEYPIEHRPWGYFEQYVRNVADYTTVKTLVLRKGQRLSLQTHEHRDEMWVPLRGVGRAEVGDRVISMFGRAFGVRGRDAIWVPRGTPHRLRAHPDIDENFEVLEIAFGEFEDSDEVRLEDDYGRVAQIQPTT